MVAFCDNIVAAAKKSVHGAEVFALCYKLCFVLYCTPSCKEVFGSIWFASSVQIAKGCLVAHDLHPVCKMQKGVK